MTKSIVSENDNGEEDDLFREFDLGDLDDITATRTSTDRLSGQAGDKAELRGTTVDTNIHSHGGEFEMSEAADMSSQRSDAKEEIEKETVSSDQLNSAAPGNGPEGESVARANPKKGSAQPPENVVDVTDPPQPDQLKGTDKEDIGVSLCSQSENNSCPNGVQGDEIYADRCVANKSEPLDKSSEKDRLHEAEIVRRAAEMLDQLRSGQAEKSCKHRRPVGSGHRRVLVTDGSRAEKRKSGQVEERERGDRNHTNQICKKRLLARPHPSDSGPAPIARRSLPKLPSLTKSQFSFAKKRKEVDAEAIDLPDSRYGPRLLQRRTSQRLFQSKHQRLIQRKEPSPTPRLRPALSPSRSPRPGRHSDLEDALDAAQEQVDTPNIGEPEIDPTEQRQIPDTPPVQPTSVEHQQLESLINSMPDEEPIPDKEDFTHITLTLQNILMETNFLREEILNSRVRLAIQSNKILRLDNPVLNAKLEEQAQFVLSLSKK